MFIATLGNGVIIIIIIIYQEELWGFWSRALNTLPTHGGIAPSMSSLLVKLACGVALFLLGLTNLCGKLPVTPRAMKRNELKTANPTTRTTPRKMLSKRPGSTTPTRRIGCAEVNRDTWRLLNEFCDVKRGESLPTSAWPIFSSNAMGAVRTVKRTSVTTSWPNGEWLQRVMAKQRHWPWPLWFHQLLYYCRCNKRRRNESRWIKGRSFTLISRKS